MNKLGFSLLLLTVGCAAGPQLARYPLRTVDRPLTHPRAVSSWTSPAGVTTFQNDFDAVVRVPAPEWVISPSDRWDILFAPIPVAAIYQLRLEEGSWCAAGITAGSIVISSDEKPWWTPHTLLRWKERVLPRFALDLTAIYAPMLVSADDDWGWSAGASLAGVVQLTNRWSVAPRFGLVHVEGPAHSIPFVPDEPREVEPAAIPPAIPLGLDVNWVIGPQWELAAAFSTVHSGFGDGYSAQEYRMQLVHFW